jgi:cytosolic carboxypeptidase protein 6
MTKPIIIFISVILSLIIIKACSAPEKTITALPYDPPGAIVTTDKEIIPQHLRTISFSRSGVFASNEFEGARLNDFYQIDETTYVAEIKPENAPINNSAWYAFKLWAKKENEITVKLKYENGTHRYHPRISNDGQKWNLLDTSFIHVDTGKTIAELKLKIGSDTLWLSAQELITSNYFKNWINKLTELSFVENNVIGYSSLNKLINRLKFNSAVSSKNYVIVIGRLHPPEVTGSFALMSFVETISGESELAMKFREKFNLIVIPNVNPDGVDNGHWRHNANGVDINRDWVEFNQPEPRAVKNEIEKIINEEKGKINFFIDFHSTTEDIFYNMSVETLKTANLPGEDFLKQKEGIELINLWLNNLQTSLPEYHVNMIDTLSKPTSPTSDRWIQREYNIPAMTYEVADTTGRELIKKVSAAAAEELMKLLMVNQFPENKY